MTKLCKECKWCLTEKFEDSKCSHPTAKTFLGKSPVDGLERYQLPYADLTRKTGACGMEGKLFELRTYPVREEGSGGRHEPQSKYLTQATCHEHGFRFYDVTKRFV